MRLFSLILVLINHLTLLSVQDNTIPFSVKDGLYDPNQPETLGLSRLSGTETITIFKTSANTNKYVNGVVLFPFKGYLYAQWQSSAFDEDAADTWVAYSRSADGINWSSPDTLARKWENGIKTSGGWWSDGGTLVAYINVWPTDLKPRGGYTEFILSSDGVSWSSPQPLTDNRNQPIAGIFEQDPHILPDSRIINAIHLQPGLTVTPFFTDDPLGITAWNKGKMPNLPFPGHSSRAIEPSSFYRPDGSVAQSNGDLVEDAVKMVQKSGARVCTIEETRQLILG